MCSLDFKYETIIKIPENEKELNDVNYIKKL